MSWQPIETAPRDGTAIVGWCAHEADPYFTEEGGLTDYGARVEGLSHVEDGPHVIAWEDARDESEGWEFPSYTIPGGWYLTSDQDFQTGTSSTQPGPTEAAPLTPEQRKAYAEIGAALEAQKKLTDMGYVWHQGAWIDYREVHSEKEQPK